MASEIKVDTVSEKTSANGVTIDGVNIKDSALVTAGSVPLTTIDIDGGTDIGAAIVDADLFIVDDGAGGTNRKVTASRIKTYAGVSGDVTTIDSLLNTDIKIGEDDQTKIDFETADTINFYAGNEKQLILTDGALTPGADNILDLGSSGVEFKDAYFDGTVTSDAGLFDTLGVITAKDLGVGIHIRTSDSSADVDNTADELIIESSGDAGLSILTGTSNSGHIMFGDSGDNNIGKIQYNHDNDGMFFFSNTAQNMCILSTGKVGVVETNPDSFLCITQGADDAAIMSFKSSDVAHGITSQAETDTYGIIKKVVAAQGGVLIHGITEGTTGVELHGTAIAGNVYDGEATNTPCIVEATGTQNDASGTPANIQAVGADNNIFGVTNDGGVQFIVKGDGEIFSNQSATVGTYDAYDDAQLVRASDLFHTKGVIDSKFDKFVKYNKKDLMDARLIGREKDKDDNWKSTSFVNLSGMSRLHNGAIWQQYEKHQQLLEAVYDLAKEAVGEKKANAILEKHEIKRLN